MARLRLSGLGTLGSGLFDIKDLRWRNTCVLSIKAIIRIHIKRLVPRREIQIVDGRADAVIPALARAPKFDYRWDKSGAKLCGQTFVVALAITRADVFHDFRKPEVVVISHFARSARNVTHEHRVWSRMNWHANLEVVVVSRNTCRPKGSKASFMASPPKNCQDGCPHFVDRGGEREDTLRKCLPLRGTGQVKPAHTIKRMRMTAKLALKDASELLVTSVRRINALAVLGKIEVSKKAVDSIGVYPKRPGYRC
jgi:hypothetical protein